MVKNYLILLNVYFFKVLKPVLKWILEACISAVGLVLFFSIAFCFHTFMVALYEHSIDFLRMDELPRTWDDICFGIFNFPVEEVILLVQMFSHLSVLWLIVIIIAEVFWFIYDCGCDLSSKLFNFIWNLVFFIILLISLCILWVMLDIAMYEIVGKDDWWNE